MVIIKNKSKDAPEHKQSSFPSTLTDQTMPPHPELRRMYVAYADFQLVTLCFNVNAGQADNTPFLCSSQCYVVAFFLPLKAVEIVCLPITDRRG